MKGVFFTIEKYFAKCFVLLLMRTIKINLANSPPTVRCIYLFWHRNLIPLMYLHRYQDIVILISSSQDGELIAGPAALFGYIPVRGSSTRGGYSALKQLFTLSKSNSIAITPDGPTGPREIVKESVVNLAIKTGLPVVGVAVDIDKEWIFRSWDLMRLPKPFSTVKVSYSSPLYLSDKDNIDIKTKRLTVQRLMDELTSENRDARKVSVSNIIR